MRVIDVILGLICGRIIGFVAGDILREFGISIGFYYSLILWIAFPIISLFFLWTAFLIGRKVLFFYQITKFLLVGAAATVIDLKFFELLSWFSVNFIISKGISFIGATSLKYWGNKHWAFLQHESINMHIEIIKFFAITLIGLFIDVLSFYYFVKIIGPQFSIPVAIWVKFSVIFAALIAALWNFLGYKFLVFKK